MRRAARARFVYSAWELDLSRRPCSVAGAASVWKAGLQILCAVWKELRRSIQGKETVRPAWNFLYWDQKLPTRLQQQTLHLTLTQKSRSFRLDRAQPFPKGARKQSTN